jgi:transcription-repair coupling factor (superfamily II helicase)
MDSIVAWLEHNGYNRSSTVREPGEYAVRGGILDLFPAGLEQPVRFDFFGDSLESIRTFDAETQRTLLDMRSLDLVPISEFQLITETIRRFRMGYVAAFGAPERDDLLYEAVSEGRRHPGMEHWLPLFSERMDTLFDYLADAPIAIEPQGEDAARERFKQIADYYEARREALEHPGGGAIYKPLPPDRLYLTEDEWARRLEGSALARLTPFAMPEGSTGVVDAGARQGRNFAPERNDSAVNVFEAVERRLARPHGQHAARPQASQSDQRQHLAHRAGHAPQRGDAGGGRHGIRLRDRQCRRHQRAGHSGRPAGAAAQGEPQARQFYLGGHQSRRRRSRGSCRARHRALRRIADA